MKYGVTKNTLLITAGIVWLLAGINILRIGNKLLDKRFSLLVLQSL